MYIELIYIVAVLVTSTGQVNFALGQVKMELLWSSGQVKLALSC